MFCNSYNTAESNPSCRIGNWVEERELFQTTGQSRGGSLQSTKSPLPTKERIFGHGEHVGNQYESVTAEAMLNGRDSTNFSPIIANPSPFQQPAAIANRDAIRHSAAVAYATALQDAEEERKRNAKEEQVVLDMFAHRPPLNHERAMKLKNPPTNALNTAAITIYNMSLLPSLQRPEIVSAKTSPFAKSSDFSQPIGEYKGETVR